MVRRKPTSPGDPIDVIVDTLGGTRTGSNAMCRCPVHRDRTPSLSVTERDGRILVHCFAGCPQSEVIAALKGVGVWPDGGQVQQPDHGVLQRLKAAQAEDARARQVQAQALYERSLPAAGSPVAEYLHGRGIVLQDTFDLRFLPDAFHGPTAATYPAMVAAVRKAPSGDLLGVHLTFLASRQGGWGKATIEPAKMMRGAVAGGGVRLAPAGRVLVVGEGIESTASFMQASGLPAWAALSTSGLTRLVLPPVAAVPEVIIAADNDPSGVKAARAAAQRWAREGRRVRIVPPPREGSDFNDFIQEGGHGR